MGFSNADVQTLLTVLTLLATTAGWLFDRYVVRRKRLSYRVHWNRPVDFTSPRGAREMNLSIVRDGELVEDPSFVVLRVENVGSFDLSADDVAEPLEFSFGGRRIVHYEVQETDPADLLDTIVRSGGAQTPGPELLPRHPGAPDETPAGRLRLPAFEMRRKARFKLLVLLSGDGREVKARARLSGGEIVSEGRRGARSRWGLALGGTSLLLGGLLVGLIMTRGVPDQQVTPVAAEIKCPDGGPLAVTGSTALVAAIDEIAEQYMASCPSARIQINANGTEIGLERLEQAGSADDQRGSTENQRVNLVMADEYAGRPARNPRLEFWPLGVGMFAVIVNKDTGISKLSSSQLRSLFDGNLLKWNDGDLQGADLEVVLVNRAVSSGTRDTFENRVLKGPGKAPLSSRLCISRDLADVPAGVLHCAMTSTAQVLEKVSVTPGAIGYANATEAASFSSDSVDIIPIDGAFPTKDALANGTYRFWAVEKLVRYGQERPPTVRDHFATHVLSGKSAIEVLQRRGYHSCTDPAFLDGEVALGGGGERKTKTNTNKRKNPPPPPTTDN